MNDGETLSISAAHENWRQIVWSKIYNQKNDWFVVGADINYEDQTMVCSHSGIAIPASYDPVEHDL